MDPNAALARIRQLVDTQLQQGLSTELADTFRGLDEWLVRGGFLPSAWQARDYSYAAAHHVEPLGPPNPADAELPACGADVGSNLPCGWPAGHGGPHQAGAELPTTHYYGDGHDHA